MPKRDRKGHFLKSDSDFTVCPSCLENDWMNYYVDLTK